MGMIAVSEDDLADALTVCGLPYLMKSSGRASELEPHSSQPAEQQRIAFCRALLLRPQWLFFDEATGALDEESEADLYRIIKQRLPETTLFSVSHRQTLAAFHDRLLETRCPPRMDHRAVHHAWARPGRQLLWYKSRRAIRFVVRAIALMNQATLGSYSTDHAADEVRRKTMSPSGCPNATRLCRTQPFPLV